MMCNYSEGNNAVQYSEGNNVVHSEGNNASFNEIGGQHINEYLGAILINCQIYIIKVKTIYIYIDSNTVNLLL
jgi:hypothetical protein